MDSLPLCAATSAQLDAALSAQSLHHLSADVAAHIAACPDCLASYLRAAERLELRHAGDDDPTHGLAGLSAGPIRRVVLSRAVLKLALPPARVARAPVRGLGDDEYVLYSDGEGVAQSQLTVMVRDSGDGTWEMVVSTTPPLVGLLRLAAGATRMMAPFLSDGSATLKAIPFALLLSEKAPDLELIILPVRGTAS